MKKLAVSTLSVALLSTAAAAHAQSSVTMYGVIDDALQFVHNANKNNQNFVGLADGNLQFSNWGLKGQEDLGGNLSMTFKLESGFNVNSGKMGASATEAKIFDQQAYVGLVQESAGTFTLGRQYDPVVDMVQPLTADNYWGSTFSTPGDVDNNDSSSRTNNAIKYASPVLGGFQFESMYAFGGVAGATGSGQTWSGAATYAIGPFSIAAGYISMDNAHTAAGRTGEWGSGATSDGMFDSQINSALQTARSISIASLAAQYVAGQFTFGARYSDARYKPDAFSSFSATQRYDVGAGFVNYQVTPVALIGLGYTYTHGRGNFSQTYNQLSLGGDYNLSKRTDLYLVGSYQHASGDGIFASVADYGYDSSARSSGIVSLGIRHKF